MKKQFGISAQPVAVAGSAVAVEAIEEKTEFDVVILECRWQKLMLLKLEALTGLGLKKLNLLHLQQLKKRISQRDAEAPAKLN